ncbi:MAG: hypothetical protein OER12_06680 [Acidimicrobiia bacterium]|nr:hypothetical protein [Acidimicrobiia bacterium]
MADDDMPVNEEHFESIPWSSLVAQTDARPWLVYVATGAVVALVVGLLVARSFPPTSAAPSPVVAVESSVNQTPPATSPTTLLSEADLRAELAPGESGQSAALARAEWFVTDYFTNDGAGGRSAEVTGALGRPFSSTGPEVTTYVEWARAWEVEHEGDGRYRVAVAFRSITETDKGFVRGLVHGVAVRVQVGPGGGTRVIDLPEPITFPPAPTPADLPLAGPVPEAIAEQAQVVASEWGKEATVLDGLEVGDAWRVAVQVADDIGTSWTLVVWVAIDG